jgi:hypothetical protein
MDICYKHIKEILDQLEGIKLVCKIITCFYETQTRNFNKDSMQEWKKKQGMKIFLPFASLDMLKLSMKISVNPVHNAPCLFVTGPGVGGGGGRGLLQTDPARHSRISTWPGPALPDFDWPGPCWGVGVGELYYRQTRPNFSHVASPASPFPHPPKPPSQTQRLTELIYTNSTGNGQWLEESSRHCPHRQTPLLL